MKAKALIVTFFALAALTATAVSAFHMPGTWYYQNTASSTKAYPYAVHSQANLWVRLDQPAPELTSSYRWLGSEVGGSHVFVQAGTKKNYDDPSLDFFTYTEDTEHSHTCLSGSTAGWGGKGCYINVAALGVWGNQWCKIEIGSGDVWVPAFTVRLGVTCNSIFYPLMDIGLTEVLTKPGFVVMEATNDYDSGPRPNFTAWKQAIYADPAIASMFVYESFFKPSVDYGAYLPLGPFFDKTWLREYGAPVDYAPDDCSWGTGAPGLQGALYHTGSDATVGATGGACYGYGELIY